MLAFRRIGFRRNGFRRIGFWRIGTEPKDGLPSVCMDIIFTQYSERLCRLRIPVL